MAKQNSISNASGKLTIDPGASGDSFIQFDINATGEFRIGVDDTAGDALKLSQGSTLGTNDTFIMTAAGERTMPINPAFNELSGNATNVTGDGTVYSHGTSLAFTENVDQGNDFYPGSGSGVAASFTAPVTGRYLIVYTPRYRAASGQGGNDYTYKLVTSNRTYYGGTSAARKRISGMWSVNNDLRTTSFAHLVDMDASDTATFTTQSSGGSKNAILGTNVQGWLAI